MTKEIFKFLWHDDWDEITAGGTDDINKIFSSFCEKLNKIVNKHALFKTMSKRRKKKLSKPWITKGISDFDLNKKQALHEW